MPTKNKFEIPPSVFAFETSPNIFAARDAAVLPPDTERDMGGAEGFGPPVPTLDGSFNIKVLARSLSRIPRFVGRMREFVSVAQHSVLVSHLTDGDPFEALMHDAAEAFTGDIPTPYKRWLGPRMVELEEALWSLLRQRYSLPATLSQATKQADMLSLFVECNLFGVDKYRDFKQFKAFSIGGYDANATVFRGVEKLLSIGEYLTKPWDHADAQSRFITRYLEVR